MKKYFFLLSFLISCNSFSGTLVEGKVLELATSKEMGNFIFIKMSNVPPWPQNNCSTNGYWHFTVPLNTEQDKIVYSTLLAAYMASKTIRIDGYNTQACNEIATVESMSTFTLK